MIQAIFRPGRAALCLLLFALVSAGGVRIPVVALRASATDYNVVLQRTSAAQLLLNLVRLRYHEAPFFMEPSAISAQLRRSAELTAQAGLNDALAISAPICSIPTEMIAGETSCWT